MPISPPGVAKDDVGIVLAFDQHLGLSDGIGLRVELPTVQDKPRTGLETGEVFIGHAQHASGARRWVVQLAYDAGLGQRGAVLNEDDRP